MLDLDSARLFLRVVECGSISRAAQEAYLAKSMVKRRIDELEAFTGTRLLTRGPRGVEPTTAGKVFVRRASEILELVNTMRMECLAATHSDKGRILRIAYYSDFVFPMVQYLCDHYAVRHPEDTILPVFVKFKDAHRNVRDGVVDVAICTRPSENESVGLAGTSLYATNMVGLVSVGSSLASKASLTRNDLADNRTVIHPMWCPREVIENWSHNGTPSFDVIYDDGNTQSMQATTVDGGIYLYPETDAYLFPYKALPLEEPLHSVSTLVYSEKPTSAVLDFIQGTIEYLKPYVDGLHHLLTIDWSTRPAEESDT